MEWISAENHMPANANDTLIYTTHGHIRIGLFVESKYGNYWISEEGTATVDQVTHWMPLPEPPKE